MSRLFLLCLLIGVAMGAAAWGKAPKKPVHLAHKEGCYVEEIKDVIPYGSDITPAGQCVRIECGKDMLYWASCGVVFSNDPNCHKTDEDLTKPYPDCCPTFKCETENKI